MFMYRITEDEYEIIQNHRKKNLREKEEEEEILEKIRIKKMLERNKKYNDHLMQFIEERIDKAEETERLSYNTIWNEYKSWCIQEIYSLDPFEKQPFRGEIEKIYGKMNNTTKGWKCIKIRSIKIDDPLSDE